MVGSAPLKILNIGSATHYTSELLTEFGDVTSLEYDEACCDFVRTVLKEEVINASATELPFEDNTFDLVCAFDVIEHIEDDKLAAKEIQRVCKLNGSVFLTVPAYQFLWSDHDRINHHFRRYTLPQFIDVQGNQISIVKKSYFNTLLFPLIAIFRILSRLKKPSKNPKSDFDNFNPNSVMNKVFEFIFKLEIGWLKRWNFPFGVSILLFYKKK